MVSISVYSYLNICIFNGTLQRANANLRFDDAIQFWGLQLNI